MALLVLIGILVKDSHPVTAKEPGSTIPMAGIVETEHTEGILEVKPEVSREDIVVEETVAAVETELAQEVAEEAVAAVETESTEAISTNTPEIVSENIISENTEDSNEEEKMKIVVFGDSIWDSERGEDGISERVMEQLDVVIYNCAVGGTAAALDGEAQNWDNWTSDSFNGMMYIANDIVSADQIIPQVDAYDVITKVDFDEVDYVIVSYGLNDYFLDIPIYPQAYYDTTSYVGALRHGIHKLREEYPQLKFIVTSPTYCEWFKGERQFELGAYVEAARSVAQEMEVEFLDMYHALGKTPDEKMEYLSDGVHLNEEGRQLYAHSVIEFLKQLEKEEM